MGISTEWEIVLPEGAGVLWDKDVVSNFLRALTRILEERKFVEKGGFGLGGEYNYGADFENNTFLMHPFCWCDDEECPWCKGCECPSSAFHHFIDGIEVSFKEWSQYYRDKVPHFSDPRWDEISREVNTHRTSSHTPVCLFCTTEDSEVGRPAGQPAPNFWHKPSGFRVWWYKWIGRGMEVENPTNISVDEIKRSVYSSLG